MPLVRVGPDEQPDPRDCPGMGFIGWDDVLVPAADRATVVKARTPAARRPRSGVSRADARVCVKQAGAVHHWQQESGVYLPSCALGRGALRGARERPDRTSGPRQRAPRRLDDVLG